MLTQGTQRLAGQVVESSSPRVQLPHELLAHLGAPETPDVIGNAGDRLGPRLGAKEIPNVVRQLYQMLRAAHGARGGPLCSAIRPVASPMLCSARLASPSICGFSRRASSAIRSSISCTKSCRSFAFFAIFLSARRNCWDGSNHAGRQFCGRLPLPPSDNNPHLT